jgi:hypothetical protein
MKQIAEVIAYYLSKMQRLKSDFRKRMLIFFWLIPETFMMVFSKIQVMEHTADNYCILGTGLVDGFPPGGIGGHDV